MSRLPEFENLEEILPEPVLDQLLEMAENGYGPMSSLLSRAIDLGLKRIVEEGPPAEGHCSLEGLTARQLAVLDCLRKGYAVGEIADILGISEVTVRTHITRIKLRIGCHDLLSLRLPKTD